ncbi:MAG: hypothetical protein KDH94_04440, partial [Coxiellaceae bacterium]|nr:hypothetical protein [Coxiellaceae bacterium]
MIGKSIIRWLISLLAITAIFIIILLTPLGLHIGLQFAKTILPGNISYDHASGVITGPIELRNFKYTDHSNIITIKKIKLSWKPWQLLRRKIVIERFRADDLHLTLRLAKTKKAETKKKQKSDKHSKPYLLEIS